MNDHHAILGTALLSFLTTVVGFVYSWYRDERRHRWQLERELHHETVTAAIATKVDDLHQALK